MKALGMKGKILSLSKHLPFLKGFQSEKIVAGVVVLNLYCLFGETMNATLKMALFGLVCKLCFDLIQSKVLLS